jgi:hypothetical protein
LSTPVTGSVPSPGLASLHEAPTFGPSENTATEVTASEDTWAAPVGLPLVAAAHREPERHGEDEHTPSGVHAHQPAAAGARRS